MGIQTARLRVQQSTHAGLDRGQRRESAQRHPILQLRARRGP
jgi:hypothetical protein